MAQNLHREDPKHKESIQMWLRTQGGDTETARKLRREGAGSKLSSYTGMVQNSHNEGPKQKESIQKLPRKDRLQGFTKGFP